MIGIGPLHPAAIGPLRNLPMKLPLPSLPSLLPWRPVTPLACGLTAWGLLIAGPASAQVADDCANAPERLGNTSFSFDTTACSDTGLPATTSATGLNACGMWEFGDTFVRWYPFQNGEVLVSTCNNASFDTVLSVYEDCDRNLSLACNDDGTGCVFGTSELTFTAEVGKSYLIVLSHFNDNDRGTGTLFITHTNPAPVPDTCSDPLNTVGIMTQTYDTTGLTTSGFNGGGACNTSTIANDGFWVWTAPHDGDWTIDTLGSNFDTQLRISAGSDCSASCIAFNDDEPGGSLQSSVLLPGLVAGDTFLIQAGGFNGASGQLELNATFTPDPCAGLTDFNEDDDDCPSAPWINPKGSSAFYPDLNVSKSDKDFLYFFVSPGATVSVDMWFTHANGDLDMFLRRADSSACGQGNGADELAEGYSASDNESLTWTNDGPDCVDVILEINVYDDPANANCNDYDLKVENMNLCPEAQATRFCDPMNANSTGVPTKLTVIEASTPTDLYLQAWDGPPGQFGYFLVSSAINEPGISVGSGRLCLGAFGRYNVGTGELNSLCQFNSAGQLNNLVGTGDLGSGFVIPSTLPFAGSPAIVSGEVWNFQLWHRELGGDSNFSNGLSIQF